MKKRINYSAFDRISSRMGKEFGTIKKGSEEEYSFLLFPMEGNLLKVNRKYQINNGRRAIEAVHICLLTVNGYLNQIEYDFDGYITDENQYYVNALLMSFDPFTNKELLSVIEPVYNLNSIDDLREYFEVPIKCLLRIEKSIDLWTKEYGITGYFDFIEEQFGRSIANDDEMNFSARLKNN